LWQTSRAMPIVRLARASDLPSLLALFAVSEVSASAEPAERAEDLWRPRSVQEKKSGKSAEFSKRPTAEKAFYRRLSLRTRVDIAHLAQGFDLGCSWHLGPSSIKRTATKRFLPSLSDEAVGLMRWATAVAARDGVRVGVSYGLPSGPKRLVNWASYEQWRFCSPLRSPLFLVSGRPLTRLVQAFIPARGPPDSHPCQHPRRLPPAA